MYDAETPPLNPLDLAAVEAMVDRATQALLKAQKPDGHWVFELEADATIPAEFILLKHYLGEPEDRDLEARIGRYLRRIQCEHSGWALFHDGAFDISATVKAYFALKMIGDSIDAPHMVRAREAILAHGGAAAANVFTRIQLALYGAGSWKAIPTMPAELILLPRWFPIHLSKMSYWARTVIVPLLVLQVLKPVAKNPRGVRVDELYLPKMTVKPGSKAANTKWLWTAGFNALDVVLKAVDPFWPKGLRKRAFDACVTFVTTRLNGEDGLGAIYPAMANSVMMFEALGYAEDHPDRAVARKSVEKLLVFRNDGEVYCQPCVSPVWDTALAAHAMLEAGGEDAERAALRGLEWLKPLQVLDVKGDWAEEKPDVRPGGWAFQYNNAYYPDLDDTAVVVMALDRARRGLDAKSYDEAIARGQEWTVGLQSKNGGWGAFDADNSYHYLNNIPFADHGALLDPPTEDVSGRVVAMLGQLGEPLNSPRMAAGLKYLEETQMRDGSWFGRWGVNYVYGTWSVLCALNAAKVDRHAPVVRKAVDWLKAIQNADGGWGEDCDSYDLAYKGYTPAPSTASQTAWALLGLMAVGEADSPAVARGMGWLQANQQADGLWGQEHYTGGGFPRVFYLRYHGYPKFFPLWAAARYRNLKRSNTREVAWGDVTPPVRDEEESLRFHQETYANINWAGQEQPSFEDWRRELQAYIESMRNAEDEDERWPGHLLIVCGFDKEAEIAAKLTEAVIPSGGQAAKLEQSLVWMRAKMPTAAALSFGLAGGLDPSLKVGDIVCAREVSGGGTIIKTDPVWTEHIARVTGALIVERVASRDTVVAHPTAKAQVRTQTGGSIVDMESHRLARWAQKGRLPMAVLRVVSDSAKDVIPSSALAGFDGPKPNVKAVVRRLAQRPWELPQLIRMAVHTNLALSELDTAARRFGGDPGMSC